MTHQLFIGGGLMLCTIVIAAMGFWVAEGGVTLAGRWLVRRPHTPKLALVLMSSVVMILIVLTLSVWLWAAVFMLLEIFVQWELSVYFALVAFTTLGFGDVVLPQEWRILGGLAAANGLLSMGVFTAQLVEVLRRVRSEQVRGAADE